MMLLWCRPLLATLSLVLVLLTAVGTTTSRRVVICRSQMATYHYSRACGRSLSDRFDISTSTKSTSTTADDATTADESSDKDDDDDDKEPSALERLELLLDIAYALETAEELEDLYDDDIERITHSTAIAENVDGGKRSPSAELEQRRGNQNRPEVESKRSINKGTFGDKLMRNCCSNPCTYDEIRALVCS